MGRPVSGTTEVAGVACPPVRQGPERTAAQSSAELGANRHVACIIDPLGNPVSLWVSKAGIIHFHMLVKRSWSSQEEASPSPVQRAE